MPVGPGRGSGAGSVVAWSLDITDLDPLRFGLLFERFLNPDRVSMPDFDIDFCEDRRGEVIAYVRDRYRRRPGGADHHLRHAAGPRRPARRRSRAGPAVRPRRPHLQAGAAQSGQSGDAGPGDRAGAAAEGGARRRSGRRPDDRHRAAARGPAAQRLHPCGGCGDRRPAAPGAGAALPRPARTHALDPVQHEGRREGGPGQVRLPWALDADHARACRAAGERAWHGPVPGDAALGRSGQLRAPVPGGDPGRVPARIRGHARRAAQAQAGLLRGHHRHGVALSAGADGQHPALHQRQAQARGPELPAPPPGIDPGRDQRRDHLPGAGDGDRQAAGRLHAGRRRSPAPRHGQEDQGGDGRAARGVRAGCGRAGRRRQARRHDLRRGGEVRLLRLQQEPRRRLRAARLPYRLAEGEPPGRVLRRGDDHRVRQPGKARGLPAGDAHPRDPALPARRQSLARAVRRGGRQRGCGRALRAGSTQGRGGGRHRCAGRGPCGQGSVPRRARPDGAAGHARDQQASPGKPRPCRCPGHAGAQPAPGGRRGRAAPALCRGRRRGGPERPGQPVRRQRCRAGAQAELARGRGLAGARTAADGVRRSGPLPLGPSARRLPHRACSAWA